MRQPWEAPASGARFTTDGASGAGCGSGLHQQRRAVLGDSFCWHTQRPDLFCFFLLAIFRGYYPGYSERIKKPRLSDLGYLKAYTQNTGMFLRSIIALIDPTSTSVISLKEILQSIRRSRRDRYRIRFRAHGGHAIGHNTRRRGGARSLLLTDDQLKRHAENNSSGHHACGTSAMEPEDLGGVVDSRFRVHGIRQFPGGRCVDLSPDPRLFHRCLHLHIFLSLCRWCNPTGPMPQRRCRLPRKCRRVLEAPPSHYAARAIHHLCQIADR